MQKLKLNLQLLEEIIKVIKVLCGDETHKHYPQNNDALVCNGKEKRA